MPTFLIMGISNGFEILGILSHLGPFLLSSESYNSNINALFSISLSSLVVVIKMLHFAAGPMASFPLVEFFSI